MQDRIHCKADPGMHGLVGRKDCRYEVARGAWHPSKDSLPGQKKADIRS